MKLNCFDEKKKRQKYGLIVLRKYALLMVIIFLIFHKYLYAEFFSNELDFANSLKSDFRLDSCFTYVICKF